MIQEDCGWTVTEYRGGKRRESEVMSKKQYSLIVVLAFVGGLVGGVVSSQLLLGQPALAESGIHPGNVRGSSFTMVDDNGKTRAKLQMQPGGPSLTLFNEKGKVIWRAP